MDDAHKPSSLTFGTVGDARSGDAASERLWPTDHDALAKKVEAEKHGILRARHGGYQQTSIDFYRNSHSLASSSPTSTYRPILSTPPATHLFHPSSRQFPHFDISSQLQSTLSNSQPLRQEQLSSYRQQNQQQAQLTRNNERRHNAVNEQYQTSIHSQSSSQPNINHSFALPVHSHDATVVLRKSAAEIIPWYHPVAQLSQAREVQSEQHSGGLLQQGGFPHPHLFDMGLPSSALESTPSVESVSNSSNRSKKDALNFKRRTARPNMTVQPVLTSIQSSAAVRLPSTPVIRKKSTVVTQKPTVQNSRPIQNGILPSTSNPPTRRRMSAPLAQTQKISRITQVSLSSSGSKYAKVASDPISSSSTVANANANAVSSATTATTTAIAQLGNVQTVVGAQKIYTKNVRGLEATNANQAPRKRRHVETVASRSVNTAAGRIACEYCGQMFDMKRTRDIHVRSYHERSFPCEKCPSLFKTKSDANRHMRIVHDRVRPFTCKECNSTFAEKSKLARHVKTVHEKLRPHVCSVCQAQFGEKGNLAQHENARHGHRSS